MAGKYGDLIKKAREPENQNSGIPETQSEPAPTEKPENQNSGIPATPERDVNLCIKVPESQRRYWMARAKEQGVTMTSVIVAALSDRFGKPES